MPETGVAATAYGTDSERVCCVACQTGECGMGGVDSVDAAAVKLVLPLDGIAGVHPADVNRGLCKAVQCKAVGTGARGVDKQDVIDSRWRH